MAHRALNPRDREYFLPESFWPIELQVPARPPLLVHLDIAQWIRFGRVRQGNGEPAYVELLEALDTAVRNRQIRIVITSAQFREVAKITDPDQRRALREVIEEFTELSYLVNLTDVFKLELQTALDRVTSTRGLGWGVIDLVGHSALHAFGRVGGLKIMEPGRDVTAQLVDEDPAWAERLASMNRTAEGMLLQGPADYEVEGLRADGYRPEKAEQQMINNAIFESEWSQRLAPYRNSRVIRDFVIHRHLQLELLDMLVREQMLRGIGIDDIFTTPESGARFVMSMPSSAVMVSMKAQYHQDPNHRWTANDL